MRSAAAAAASTAADMLSGASRDNYLRLLHIKAADDGCPTYEPRSGRLGAFGVHYARRLLRCEKLLKKPHVMYDLPAYKCDSWVVWGGMS